MDKRLLLFLLVGLMVRVCYVLTLENRFYFPDEKGFDRLGLNISQFNGYSYSKEPPYRPTAHRVPVYPLFVGLCYLIFGHNFLSVRLLQSLLSILSAVIIYHIAKRLNKSCALISSAIYSLWPFSIFYCGYLLTETLFIFLFLSFFALFLSERKLSAGILFGLCLLTKPSLLLFPLFLFFFRGRLSALSFLYTMLISFSILSLWSLRNTISCGEFVLISTRGGAHLYEALHPDNKDGGPLRFKMPEETKGMSPAEADRYFRNKAIGFIKEDPKRFFKLCVKKFFRFWDVSLHAEGYRSLKYNIISWCTYLPVLILGIFGIFASLSQPSRFLLLYTPILYFTLLHMIVVSSIRYREPVMPFLIIFGSWGINRLLSR
jgi:hypothetical protein